MFIAFALVPIMMLAFVAYAHYPAHFKSRAFDLLQRCAKTQGMSIYEHLLSAENEMLRIRDSLVDTTGASGKPLQTVLNTNSETIFKCLAVYRSGEYVAVAGDGNALGGMKPSIVEQISAGSQHLYVSQGPGYTCAVIYMVQKIDSSSQPGICLIGIINTDYLWGSLKGSWLPEGMDFCIWDEVGVIRQSRTQGMDDRKIVHAGWAGQGGNTMEGKTFYAGRWVIFLKPHFLSPSWTITVFQSKAQVMAPITAFNRYFVLIISAVLVLLTLLTSIMVRKSLVPIEQLMNGVRQISHNNFGYRVQVASKDEFQELAQAFNHMSDQVEKQFRRLTLRSDLDRKILPQLDTEKIVMAALDRVHAFFPSRAGAITIISDPLEQGCKTYVATAGSRDVDTRSFHPGLTEKGLLADHGAGWLEIEPGTTRFEYLCPLRHEDGDRFVIFPVLVRYRLFAMVTFGVDKETDYNTEDLQQARESADQLATAFSNANLISELQVLNWGTLHALARTVDAKSSWTAGHSVRVMHTCLDIGRAMKLPAEAMNDLHRSALLHDIGKIGIPLSILNKESGLTHEERHTIQTHPDIGIRILSPIKAYERLLPIIHQHHERYDGKGYPLGLRADQIHESARILAVADTYDALVSDRPYRQGMPVQEAIDLIKQLAGSQLDPMAVETFVHLAKNQDKASLEKAPNNEEWIHSQWIG